MISFVWPPGAAMLAGTGGSETYTAGHVRELRRRCIEAQVVTLGHGTHDGRQDFPDVPFVALRHEREISELAGTVVFVNKAYDVPTRHKACIILHCAIPKLADKLLYKTHIADKTMIATSIYSAQQWALYLDVPAKRIHIVLPFADPLFASVRHSKVAKKPRIIYAGRLHPEKGIYTLLEMMHDKDMQHHAYDVSIVLAGQHVPIGKEIARMLKNYPYAVLIPPQKDVQSMARLLARHDILIMPSVFAEPFGMLSIEAQHAGCRVVASNLGGIPETNCGLLTLVEPRSPRALLTGIKQAIALGAASATQRTEAAREFTLTDSVTALLRVVRPRYIAADV